MALVTRAITNVGDPLVDSSGIPIVGATISFVLVDANRRPTDT
jgi:hypothetical protein